MATSDEKRRGISIEIYVCIDIRFAKIISIIVYSCKYGTIFCMFLRER